MGTPLKPLTVDVALSTMDQTPPNTAGPVGRLTSLVNSQITKYLAATATPGVATGARVKIEQREAFRALTTTIRSSVDGSVVTPAWGPAELLDSLDDQLVSIDNSIPRVKTNADWTAYLGSRVVTRKLQQSVAHTVNGIIQAPDSAWLSGVTCMVWIQKTTAFIGFKADNGAWVVPPQIMSFTSTMPKVVSDGVNFWVFFVAGTTVTVQAYDTHGALLATNTAGNIPDTTTTPYDITAKAPGVLFAVSDGTHIRFTTATISGAVITVTNNTDASTVATGPIGFLTNPINALAYVAATNGFALNVYQVTAMAATHTYSLPVVPDVPDSLIGWVDNSLKVFVSAGILASTLQTIGPAFDPRCRRIITYSCTTTGTTATVKTSWSVLPVSRAFQMDDDWYACTYYQGGPGISQTAGTLPITWTAGDLMKGAAVQPLKFSPGDFQYGNAVAITRSTTDRVAVGLNAAWFFSVVPGPLQGLSTAQLGQVYQGGTTLTISGASLSGNNGTFQVFEVGVSGSQLTISGPITTQTAETFGPNVVATLHPSSGSISPYPDLRNTWNLGTNAVSEFPDASWVGEMLFVNGTSQPANFGSFQIDSVNAATAGRTTISLDTSFDMQPEYIPNPVQPTAVLELHLTDPSTAYEFFLQSITFDQSVIGGTLSVVASGIAQNNTVYQIVSFIDANHVIAVPINGSSNQVNREFPSVVKINISFPTKATESAQPTWFIQPLAVTTQATVGRFEYGLAYWDWRFDGASDTANDLYPCDLTSVVSTSNGLQVVLPYRAESFSAGVTAPTGNPVNTFFSTVGIKAFTLSSSPGQSLTVAGELIIPGPQASEFTASGFAEQGINLGAETPFLVSQGNDTGIPIGLTPGTQYQYIVVFEFTDEDGDRIYSVPSGSLNVNLSSANNTITIGGNILQPTQRLVTISIYRTSIAGGSTTIQHYKITNDTDPNGAGFTFPDIVTWNFKDQRPDSEILVSEVLYTDKGFLPRYPCPAFIQGVGTWRNRTWVIGYDGAIWMSGEKTEGDAVWFHPAFRYTLPTDDEPTCLASMDDYLIINAFASNWYIPAVQFPDATGNNGQLPAPVQLPFANGGTGFAVTTRDGVIYSSTAGGIWLIPRNLTNGWLSQAIQQSLGLNPITGLAVDQNQRVFVSIGAENAYVWDTIPGAWYQWNIPTNSFRVAEWQGNFVYADGFRVMQHTPGNYADNIGGSDIAIPPSWTLAPLHFMGSVRGYGRCWAFQLQGDYMGPHFMNLTLGYGDEVDYQPPTVFPPFLASPTLSYLYEWNPQEEEASQFELAFVVTFPSGVAGNSATWELISFDVGIDSGIARVAPQKRVSSG